MCTNQSDGWMMPFSGQKHAQLLKTWWHKDGQTQYENFIRRKSFIHFGIISAMPMPAMQAYVSITFCLAHNLMAVLLRVVLTVMFGDGKKQAIMLLFGLSWLTTKTDN